MMILEDKVSKYFHKYHLGFVFFTMLTLTWYRQNIFGYDFYVGYLTVPLIIIFFSDKKLILFKLNKNLNIFISVFIIYNIIALYNSSSNLFLTKSISSIVIFLLFVLLISNYSKKISDEQWEHLPRIMFYTLALFCLFALTEYLFPKFWRVSIIHPYFHYLWDTRIIYHNAHQFSGFFTEPSYFVGFSFIVFLASTFERNLYFKFLSLFLWLLVGFLSFGATYIILSYGAIVFFILLKSRMVGLLIILFSMLLIIADFNYTNLLLKNFPDLYHRLTSLFIGLGFSFDTIAPYYSQGIKDTLNALILTNFIGTGFNTMGTLPRQNGFVLDQLISLGNYHQNITDGSFLFIKLIYEMGFFGFFCFLYLVKIFFSFSFQNKTKKNEICKAIIFACILIFFVRSGVYFHYLILIIPISSYLFDKKGLNS